MRLRRRAGRATPSPRAPARAPSVAARDELRLLAADLGDAEDVRVGAELLDDLDLGGDPVRRELERLGPQADDDRAVRRRQAGRQRHVDAAERAPSRSPSGTVQRFIDGEPMKPATNVFAGRS